MAEYTHRIRGTFSVGNDAYTQEDINLPLNLAQALAGRYTGKTADAFIIHRIRVKIDKPMLANGDHKTVQLTRQSKPAIVDLDEQDLMWQFDEHLILATNGQSIEDLIMDSQQVYPPLPVSQPKLFLGIHHKTGASANVTYEIFYSVRKVSQQQLMAMQYGN